jgi:hypothetical protein
MDGQTTDIIIQREIIMKYGFDKIKIEDETCIKHSPDLRKYIYKYLKLNQDKLGKDQLKILYKQNLIAITKDNLHEYVQKLYIEPIKYNKIRIVKNKTYSLLYDKIIKDIKGINFDINDYNIYTFLKDNNKLIQELVTKYLALETVITTSISEAIAINESTEASKEESKEESKNKEIEIFMDKNENIDTYITKNFEFKSPTDQTIIDKCKNSIMMISDNIDMNNIKNFPIIILYNIPSNKIIIIDTIVFYLFLVASKYDVFNYYTVISLYSDTTYGTELDKIICDYIRIICKSYLNKYYLFDKINPNISLYYKKYLVISEEKEIIKETPEFKRFYKTFKREFINFKIDQPITNYNL